MSKKHYFLTNYIFGKVYPRLKLVFNPAQILFFILIFIYILFLVSNLVKINVKISIFILFNPTQPFKKNYIDKAYMFQNLFKLSSSLTLPHLILSRERQTLAEAASSHLLFKKINKSEKQKVLNTIWANSKKHQKSGFNSHRQLRITNMEDYFF